MWIPEAWYLRYEPVRVIEYFVKAPLGDTQSAAWLKHYGNSSPAAVVPELQVKPDLGPLVEQFTASYSTIAATASVSKQLFDDWEQLGATLPHEIQAAIIDEENQQVLNGNGEDSNMLGIFNQPDTLTRVSPTITSTAYTAIDVLVDAITDIRVNNAYAEADLIILNPEDWNSIRRIKNTLGSFVLNANAAMQAGEIDNVFAVPVVSTTTCPVGKAVVMDTKIGALAFPRTGLEIMFNPYGDWAFIHNAVQFRGEIRETIGVAYPTAINLVSNINYEAGGPFC
jgi:HK97 family phage major capsid protein